MQKESDSDEPTEAPATVAKLKELLFNDESATIDGLAKRLEEVHSRAGSDEKFRASVANVIDEALIEAERLKHDDVSRAMAPLVVKTIKSEFLNSQDEMVESLYPITGRMVKTYVANAMRDLANEINRRIENNSIMLRFRSLITGRRISDLVISDSQRLQIDELYLIRRGSGELLQRWPATGQFLSNSDIHLSGVLTAINDFAAHAFQDEGGTIRNFAVEDYSMFLRASPKHLLAAKCTGIPATGIDRIVDDEFLKLLENVNNDQPGTGAAATEKADTNQLALTKDALDKRITKRFDAITAPLPFKPAKVLAYTVLIPLLAGLGWWAYTSYEAAQTRHKAETILAEFKQLKNFPIDVKVGYRGRSLTVSGLSPDPNTTDEVLARLNTRLKAADVKVTSRLTSIATDTSLTDAIISRIKQNITSNKKRLQDNIAANRQTSATVAATQRKLESSVSVLLRNITLRDIARTHSTIANALNRAQQRLEAALPAFTKIKERTASKAKTNKISLSQIKVVQAIKRLKTYQSTITAASKEHGALNHLNGPLHTMAQSLFATSNDLFFVAGNQPSRITKIPANDAMATGPLANFIAAEADQVAALAMALASLPKPTPLTPRQKLINWTQNNVIFFAENEDFRTPSLARRKLEQLAALIRTEEKFTRQNRWLHGPKRDPR